MGKTGKKPGFRSRSPPGSGASTAIQAAVGSSKQTIFVDAEKGEDVMQETNLGRSLGLSPQLWPESYQLTYVCTEITPFIECIIP